MKLKLLTLEELFNPPKDWVFANVDNGFFKNMIDKKFPGSIITTFNDISDIAKHFKSLIKSMEYRSDILAANLAKRDQKYKNMRKNDLISLCDRHFYKKNNIDGIILPARRNDRYDLVTLVKDIDGRFGKSAQKTIHEWEEIYTQSSIEKLGEGAGKLFYTSFEIPVFEVYKTIPGYRFQNQQIGKEEFYVDKIPYIKCAFDCWLDRNFYIEDKKIITEAQLP